MIREFNNYVNTFDIGDYNIMRKVEHSLRVMELNKKYAKKLGYSKEEIELAGEIGLLHDIGRFMQLKMTNSFSDIDGFDHADYGIQYLFKEGNISKYVKDKDKYDTIKFAIKFHNKYKIGRCEDRDILKQAKLIRDTDKMDIIYLKGALGEFNLLPDDSSISAKVERSLHNKRLVKSEDIVSVNDKVASTFALIYDVNNDMCLKEIKHNIDDYYKLISNNNKFDSIYKEICEYVDDRLKNF